VWYVVRDCARRLELEHIAPHDLRRTCAKLCHSNGGELEQIQFLLGHASVLTTERYLGCKQNLEQPVNDRFGSLIAFKEMATSEGLYATPEDVNTVSRNASKTKPTKFSYFSSKMNGHRFAFAFTSF
jgi:hypothetical protein